MHNLILKCMIEKDTILIITYVGNLELSRSRSAFSSKSSYHKDPEKSRTESTAWSKECYHNDLDKSQADFAARSKVYYHADLEQSRADSAARSKASYDKDPVWIPLLGPRNVIIMIWTRAELTLLLGQKHIIMVIFKRLFFMAHIFRSHTFS